MMRNSMVPRPSLHVDDLANALLFLMQHYSGESHVNVGVGKDMSIRELAELVVRFRLLPPWSDQYRFVM